MKNETISLDEIFSFVSEKGPIIVAVSGGSDSMAALFLANAWARKSGREIHAVTVDHGLRSEAAAEAAFVAMVCDGLDIVHTTLSWDAIKPSSGLSAAARTARYDLMEEFAADIGVRIIVTGHTSDDQAETVMMRLRRSRANTRSVDRGHSGMCRRTMLGQGTLLLRPFLNLTRQRLRTYLHEVSQSWIEDPSNHDESYERVRVRAELECNAILKRRLLEYSSLMGRMRGAVSNHAAALLGQCCSCGPGHVFELEGGKLLNAPHPIVMSAIKTVIAVAGGGQYLVSDQQMQQVLDAFGMGSVIEHDGDIGAGTLEITARCTQRMTLGNCIVEYDGAKMQIYREARNLNSAVVEVGESYVWDGRIHITNYSQEDIRIEAMSADYIAASNETGNERLSGTRRAVLLSSPVITTSSGLSIPVYFDKSALPDQLDIRTGARAIENFCPQWDFALLEWLKSVDLATDQRNVHYPSRGQNLN